MPSSPLDSTDGGATSNVSCHHCPWETHTAGRRRAWHAIITLGQQTRSNDVGRGMPSSPLGSTHGRTTSGVACHHHPWQHTRSSDVRRGMPSSPLGSTHGRTASNVACHHSLLAAHTVERRRTWHTVIAVGQHTRSNDFRRGMPSSPLVSTDGRTTSSVACHYRPWVAHTVERRRTWHTVIALG